MITEVDIPIKDECVKSVMITFITPDSWWKRDSNYTTDKNSRFDLCSQISGKQNAYNLALVTSS